MTHQPIVGCVVPGDVVEIVAERIAFAEQGPEHGKAAVDGMPPDPDDWRAVKCYRNRACVQIIERQLFNDAGGRVASPCQRIVATSDFFSRRQAAPFEDVSCSIRRGLKEGGRKVVCLTIRFDVW